MSDETFGAMLRRHREWAFLSQNALARAAGIDPAYVNRIESEKPTNPRGKAATPTRTVVLALAEVLDVSQLEADRMLFAAGLAPQVDWQTRAIAAEVKLAAIREALAEDDEPTVLRRRTG